MYSELSYVSLSLFTENTEWIVSNTEVAMSSTKHTDGLVISEVTTCFDLTRRPVLEVLYTILPALLFVILSLSSCFVPPNSGERLSFSITSYLSFTFAMSAFMLNMPRDAINISLTSYVALILMFVNTTNVLWSVIIVRISAYPTEKVKIPEKLADFITKTNKSRSRKVSPEQFVTRKRNEVLRNTSESGVIPSAQDPVNATSRKESVKGSSQVIQATDFEPSWLDLANYLDKIFFGVMMLATVLVCLVFVFLIAPY